MNIDQMTIAVRERSIPEVYDLALQISRRHFAAIAVLGTVTGLPLSLVNWWLLHDPFGTNIAGSLYLWMLLVAVELPLLTAPVTLYLGQAMFDPRPSRARALRETLRTLPRLVALGLLNGLLSVAVITQLFVPRQTLEVFLLERPGRFGAGWSRAWRLGRFYFGENISAYSMNLLIFFSSFFIVMISIFILALTFSVGIDLNDPIASFWNITAWWPHALALACFLFFTVLRFAAYLDLRTKREGWEVELQLRRVGNQLSEGVRA